MSRGSPSICPRGPHFFCCLPPSLGSLGSQLNGGFSFLCLCLSFRSYIPWDGLARFWNHSVTVPLISPNNPRLSVAQMVWPFKPHPRSLDWFPLGAGPFCPCSLDVFRLRGRRDCVWAGPSMRCVWLGPGPSASSVLLHPLLFQAQAYAF